MSGTGLQVPGVPYSFGVGINRNLVKGHSIVHKFGHNKDVGTSYEPVVAGGVWQTPQVSGATQLRVKAGDANDTAAGSGAREVTIVGLDATGVMVSETLATAGTSASANTTNSYVRLLRFYVSASGTYGTQSTSSHVAAIVIEDAAGANDWGMIDLNGFGHGQSQIGIYTTPKGYDAFLSAISIQTESTKPTSFLFLKRENILETAAPYSAVRTFQEFVGVEGAVSQVFDTPIRMPELTDFGPMAKVSSGSAEVSVEMEIVLVEK